MRYAIAKEPVGIDAIEIALGPSVGIKDSPVIVGKYRYLITKEPIGDDATFELEFGPEYAPFSPEPLIPSFLNRLKLLNFPHAAYWVRRGLSTLYNSISAATLSLTGLAPSEEFFCRNTISEVDGHADCSGTMTVNDETLTFTEAGTVITETALSALPTITTSGLDCQIAIECVDRLGSSIEAEIATPVRIRFENTENITQRWEKPSAQCMICNPSVQIGDIIRYNSYDYTVIQINSYPWLNGQEVYRDLILE